jgi:hypothetical protein
MYVCISSEVTACVEEMKLIVPVSSPRGILASGRKTLEVWMWSQIVVKSSNKPCPIHTWRRKIPENDWRLWSPPFAVSFAKQP